MSMIDEFCKKVHDTMENDSYTLAEGGVSNFDEYRYRVGIRKGLRKALQIMEDVVEEAHRRDEKF